MPGVTSIGDDAFQSCVSLKSITIPESVTSIGSDAFAYCSSLTGVTIPESITSLGDFAFWNCSSLTNITVPENVTSILNYAFCSCSSLTSITIPTSVTTIEEYAFSGCRNLKDVYYEGTKEQWNAVRIYQTFDGEYLDGEDSNEPLRNATIHYGKVLVAYDANGGTGAPAAQTKEAGVALTLSSMVPTRENTAAGSYEVALVDYYDLNSTTVLQAARTNSYTFKGWNTAADGTQTDYAPGANYTLDEDLTLYAQWDITTTTAAVTLPTMTWQGFIFKGWATSPNAGSGVIGEYTPTDNVTLYSQRAGVGSGTWGDLSWTMEETGLLTISGEGEMKDFSYALENMEAWRVYWEEIIEVVIKPGVTSIGSGAFLECTRLKSVTIPESVTSIGSGAFQGCSSLTSVTIPESVTSIGNGAFSDCSSLTSVTIPEGVTSIDWYAFSGCSSLTSVTIPAGVTSIGESVFESCSSLTSVTIPESVTFIDYTSFGSCTNLKDVYYAGTKTQWEAIHNYDYTLRNATIHYGKVLETYTVAYDANGGTGAPAAQTKEAGAALTLSAVVPTRENTVGDSFEVKLDSNDGSDWVEHGVTAQKIYGYTADEDLTLYAQWGITTTTAAVTLPTLTRNGYTFKGWAASSSADAGVTGSYTPRGNVTLHAIWQMPISALPASLTTIEAEAFMGSAFTYVKLSENTSTIEARAFADCPNLDYIYIPRRTVVIAQDAFAGVEGLTILGYSGSYAEFYAKRGGIAFVTVE